ncbi:MAG: class I SAM-dependent methyltransferase [Patescibacteria group bacterium]|nr:class I SAM-dependent methyltransferase [Patescibacteria group bacterium]
MNSKAEKIKQLYDICCTDYDRHMVKTGHYTAQEKILELISDQIAEPILDLACGTGFLIKLLSKKFTNIVGNDFSAEMVKIAKDNTNVSITTDNAETLESYDDKKFKTIICCNLFFYLQNRNEAINRWAKLLDQDGKIIFIEEYPFVEPSSQEMDKHTTELMDIIDPLSPQDIQKVMTQNGFELIKQVKTEIDEQHSLYGLMFSLK